MNKKNKTQKACQLPSCYGYRRRVFHLVFFSLLMAVSLGSNAVYGEDWKLEEGFENPSVDGQQIVGWTVNGGILSIDNVEAFKGKRSLKLTPTEPFGGAVATHKIAFHSGDEVEFSIYVKGKQIRPVPGVPGAKVGANVWVQWRNAKGVTRKAVGLNQPLVGTFHWRKIARKIKLPPKVVQMEIAVGLNKGVSGTLWIDEVRASKVNQVSDEGKPGIEEALSQPETIILIIVLFFCGIIIGVAVRRHQTRKKSKILWEQMRTVIRIQMLQQGISQQEVDFILHRMDSDTKLRHEVLSKLDLPLERLQRKSVKSKSIGEAVSVGAVCMGPVVLPSWNVILPCASFLLGYFIGRINIKQ